MKNLIVAPTPESRIARRVARLCARRPGLDPVRFAAAALDLMLGCALENPETLETIVARAGQKSLASQLPGI